MPELPEVETIKRDLEKSILGLTIQDIQIFDRRVINKLSPQSFIKQLKSQKIISVSRRAKALILGFESRTFLTVQPKMTGFFFLQTTSLNKFEKETKVVFTLSNGVQLIYNDQRMFGKLSFVEDLETLSYLNSAGPEPLETQFTLEWLQTQAQKRSIPVKQLLLDQKYVAGIGNIYASEILFASGINPKRKANRINLKEMERIQKMTIQILNEAIEFRGTSMRNYRDTKGEKGKFMNRIKVYGRAGESCFVCKSAIVRLVQAQRSTFFCPRCQK